MSASVHVEDQQGRRRLIGAFAALVVVSIIVYSLVHNSDSAPRSGYQDHDLDPNVCKWCSSVVNVTPSAWGGGICAQCRTNALLFWENIRTVKVP